VTHPNLVKNQLIQHLAAAGFFIALYCACAVKTPAVYRSPKEPLYLEGHGFTCAEKLAQMRALAADTAGTNIRPFRVAA
jgi:hypothetical protein